jgi:LuxR family maltose regulon positive regulatory protein
MLQLEHEELLIDRFLIEQAKSKEALARLNQIEVSALEEGRFQTVLEVQVVKARAYIVDQDATAARHILHEVCSLASREGYKRVFLDEGNILVAPLRSLLPAVHEYPLITTYLHSLLVAFAQQEREQKRSGRTVSMNWIEPLTPQEERILILFAGGKTKQEIANDLFISINTVKTHLKRVYQKLAIRSRSEARQIARSLDLLQ